MTLLTKIWLEKGYKLVLKLFYRNLKISAPCCDAIITKLGQHIKMRNYNNFHSIFFFFFLTEEFLNFETLIFVVTSLFQNWNYLGRTYIWDAFLTFWNCGRFWSVIRLATLQKSYFQGYLLLQNTISGPLQTLKHITIDQSYQTLTILERRCTLSQLPTYFIMHYKVLHCIA